MKETRIRVKLTFLDEMLGTAAAKEEIYAQYIGSKAPDAKSKEEEIAAIGLEKAIENAMTIFPKDEDGTPIVWPYQIKGFFKSAQKAMNDTVEKGDRKTSKAYMPSFKGKIDQLVFVKAVDAQVGERKGIRIHIPEGMEMGKCERPLRAETMQGPRVALASSESVPAGSWIEFDIITLTEALSQRAIEWLEYGKYNGLGQWRNASKGAFSFEVIDIR